MSAISLSIKISLAAFGFLFVLIPTARAKTFLFENQSYELSPSVATATADLGIRSPNVFAAAKRILLDASLPPATLIDSQTISEIEQLADSIDQSARNAKLLLDQGKVLEFDPGQNGQSLDTYALYQLLMQPLTSFSLPVLISFPQIKLSETNNLGINELVGVGESDFSGSPQNRIHNIKIGSQKFNNVLLAPGAEFSFNKYLGDVDEKNGFLPELVIKKTGLVPELGGGLCQVSSTVFRAAMNSGLPITERRNHSFAVRYYAPQGTDATIYPGATDFRFFNDLPSHLLISTRVEGNKLYFDFYGTKDNRKVAFDGPYQYDKKEDGSMKAAWTRTVTNNGEEKTQTFKSTYLPPALFTKTSTVESNIPNPQSNANETPSSQTTE
ncbi:MAG: VanW family protein [Candidatus Doudnabacteria bacterium]|nr:VanW family protein [Candidatus Doudnabacteria bacterium]